MPSGKGWWVAIAITAFGFAVRAAGIAEFWVNGDEGIYDFLAHAPAELADPIIAKNAHPPLYFALMRLGVELLSVVPLPGDDFLWLRLPAVVAGSLAIFAIYLLGRELAGERCGLAAALGLALAPAAIALSQVIRPYALMTLLAITALWLLARHARLRHGRDAWLSGACLSLALATQYGSFVLLGGLGLTAAGALLARRLDLGAARTLALAQLPVVGVVAWLYASHLQQLMGSGMQSQAVEGWLVSQFVAGPADVARNLADWLAYLLGSRFAGPGLLALAGGLAACLADRRFALAGVCVATLALAVGLSALSLYPFGGTRHSLYLAPVVLVPMAYGVTRLLALGALPSLAAAGVAAAWALAPSVAPGLALGGARDAALPSEFEMPRREMQQIRASLEALAGSPGLAITDIKTSFVLSPLLHAVRPTSRRVLEPPSEVFHWGERLVLVNLLWNMDAGRRTLGSRNHLAALLQRIERHPELAGPLERELLVISAGGRRIPRSIRRLADSPEQRAAVLEEIVASPRFVAFRLDRTLYRELLDAQP